VRHAAECDGLVDEVNIELLQEELKDLAGRYHQLDPMNVLVEARLARDLAYALGERTRNVAQVADLHPIAGVACGLLAVGSFDLGLGGPAARQVRAAAAYARLLGHTGLRTWAAGTTALIANWAGQPKEALKSISEAAQSGTGGIGSARLHAIEARAWSLLGDAPQVHAALATADASLDAASGDDDLYDDVGGELGWGISIHSACAGTALLAINDAELAARRIRIALDTWPVDPCGGMVAERARVDLAAAELAGGHFDALLASLDEVWAVPATLRRHGLVARLAHLRLNLRGAAWHDHRPAAELSERIEVFCRESAAIPEIA
jgi:hypothetical protein